MPKGIVLATCLCFARPIHSECQIGAFSSVVRQQMRGVSLAGIINSVGDDMRGVQISGVSNVVKGGNGMQLSLFNNVSSSPFSGVQLSGLSNVSMGMKRLADCCCQRQLFLYAWLAVGRLQLCRYPEWFSDRFVQCLRPSSSWCADWCHQL